MSTASTTVFLYIGLDKERRAVGGNWPGTHGGHIELVSWLEGVAMTLDSLYEDEFADLNLSCVFDYEITEELGAWLYHNAATYSHVDFTTEARKRVAIEAFSDAMRMALVSKS